jgi:L-amino acid N-acyltransferase YncA
MSVIVRSVARADAPALTEIYNHYVTTSIVTFEEQPVTTEEFSRRIDATMELGLPWVVAVVDGPVVGYAYASRWKARSAYRHSVESTVYVAPKFTGQRLGLALYEALFDRLRAHGEIHAVLGGIALPNDPSIRLHEKLGMTKVGHLEQVGFKFGKWIDVAYWQLLL